MQSLSVRTKKLNKMAYHLATFNEPLSREATRNLPAHIIEEPAPEANNNDADELRDRYKNVHDMQRLENKMGQDFNDLGRLAAKSQYKKEKAMLVYEESHCAEGQDEPTKYLGYRDRFKSSHEYNQKPNYAFLIYDKKIQSFRLVPIETHVRFKKADPAQKKNQTQGQDAVPQVDIGESLARHTNTAKPPKKHDIFGKLKDRFRKNINAQRDQILFTVNKSQQAAQTSQVEAKKKRSVKRSQKKKAGDPYDQGNSDSGDCDIDFEQRNSDDESRDSREGKGEEKEYGEELSGMNNSQNSDDGSLSDDAKRIRVMQNKMMQEDKDQKQSAKSSVQARDRDSSDFSGLASEFDDEEQSEPQVGQRRTHNQMAAGYPEGNLSAQNAYRRYEDPSKRQNRGGF